ncbi:MAG: DUF4920 domain-containing protein [Filimonas sp.]|nr:DUF4920 domain-containing protein [Filimonas sp.]
MKKLLVLSAAILFTLAANAQPPQGNAAKGTIYGDQKTTSTDAFNIAKLPLLLNGDEAKNVKVIAKVVDVCPKKGCWVKLQVNDTTTAFVKMKDYAFFVPTSLVGKTIVLDGEAKNTTTSVDALKHYAEDAKKSKEEIAAITQPKKEIRFTANGIVVVD